MSIFSFIGNLFAPVANLVDELHVSDEERGKIQIELDKIKADAQAKFIELEKARLEAMQKVEVAEAGSKYWLRANWRPLCSISLVVLIIASSFGLVTVGPQIYDLAQVFLGAYAGGRSVEKVASLFKR